MKHNFRSSFISQTLKSESGIALLLVMGVIAILTFLLADFTFETKLNKIKIYNQQDKIQARLNAEAGLNFALAKLRLYQEGRNKIEKDENLKSAFPSSDLESIILEPFVFPLPMSAKANIIQKSAMDEFLKKTIFNGELALTFTKISGFLNPNGLRIQVKKPTGPGDQDAAAEANPDGNPPEGSPTGQDSTGKSTEKTPPTPAWTVIEKKLTETLQRLIKDKNDNDEDFHGHYANLDANYLVKELAYYVNDKGLFQDTMLPEIEAKFSQKNITPKFAPLTSIDELYLLPSWDDAIVDLIKDRMCVHEVSVIAINEITSEDLKILFPSINAIQIEEFFKHRDGDPDKKIKAQKFKGAEDFKRVVVSDLNIVSESEYNERIATLKEAGLVIDTSGKLYKVTSKGSMNNSNYTIAAFIDLPIKPQPPAKKTQPKPPGGMGASDGNPREGEDPTSSSSAQDPKAKDPPPELLLPRVIEIRLE